MLDVVRPNGAEANAQTITFFNLTIHDFSASNEYCDVLLSLSVLYLLPNKEADIAKVYETLMSAGVLVSSTNCIANSLIDDKVVTSSVQLLA
jgi:hypothetical protein